MTARLPRVFSIAPDQPFLEVLAQSVLAGLPNDGDTGPDALNLARTTILVPTRRAARELERILYDLNGRPGLLLPRIRPIGDIDEELFEAHTLETSDIGANLPEAISTIGRDLILVDLIGVWARENPQERLAGEILTSPHQSLALAASLTGFLDALETEDIDTSRIPDLYGIEAARHREAILSFLSLIREKLPARLHALNLLGPNMRRSLLLRREAARLIENPPSWPIIAAGSTGSIPATRELLGAIARLPRGAVVLPGLDTHMDDESWAEITAQHPQFILRQLLDHLAISRRDVQVIPGADIGARAWLSSEMMRPTGTSEQWSRIAAANCKTIERAFDGLELVEAQDVREEALAISLVLRETLEAPGKTASLVTPDRELARRVKQELLNLGVEIDDSAGEPLIGFGGAAFMSLAIDFVLGGYSAARLLALLKHDMCRFGLAWEASRKALGLVELSVFRTGFAKPPISGITAAVQNARTTFLSDTHAHPAIQRHEEEDWQAANDYANRLSACLEPLVDVGERPFATHLATLIACCEDAAGPMLWSGEEGNVLTALLAELQNAGDSIARCRLAEVLVITRHYLMKTPLRRKSAARSRLAILGLLEARLARPDVMVLGGLNEGRWPASPDPGPWLNRPMRDMLGMQQPERDIGQTAHDFVQALGSPKVVVTWSRRVGGAPAIPSRWILRLRVLVKAAGLESLLIDRNARRELAARLDEPYSVQPCERPMPRPPVESRPDRLSVTRVETLIRDPFAIYAERVLRLRPLDDIASKPDLSVRGMLFHGAIADFLRDYPSNLPVDTLDQLLRRGRERFGELLKDSDAGTFWWPQFVRISEWLAEEEAHQRQDVERVFSEIDGRLELTVADHPFTLTCRADRIDLYRDGSARILDYKTGSTPTGPQVQSGLAPQLTLQAAMLEQGAFPALGARQPRAIAYVKLGSNDPPGKLTIPRLVPSLMDCAHIHMAGLIELLSQYANRRQAYLPRVMVEKEDEERPYDHLSRFREWALSGDAK